MPEECILGVVYGLIGPALCQIPNQKGRTNGCWLAHTNTTSSASTAFANMLITAVYRRRQRFVRHVAKFNQRGVEGDSVLSGMLQSIIIAAEWEETAFCQACCKV